MRKAAVLLVVAFAMLMQFVCSPTESKNPPSSPVLKFPSNDTTGISINPTIKWNAASDASTYNIQVATDSSFINIVKNQTGVSGDTFAIAGLSHCTRYYWHVRSSNENGLSSWSTTWSFSTSSAIPSKVSIINVDDSLTAPFPALTFANTLCAQTYIIERRLNTDIAFDSIGATTDTSFIDIDTSLLPETTYYYKVKARNADGDGLYSDSVSVITPSYMVLSPKQGDVFKIGDTLRVLVKTAVLGTTGGIKFGEGLNEISPPGVAGTLSMYPSLMIKFKIPATIMPFGSTTPISAVSDSCYMRIFDYQTLETFSYSYGYFKITN
jgi:hypothetical protein